MSLRLDQSGGIEIKTEHRNYVLVNNETPPDGDMHMFTLDGGGPAVEVHIGEAIEIIDGILSVEAAEASTGIRGLRGYVASLHPAGRAAPHYSPLHRWLGSIDVDDGFADVVEEMRTEPETIDFMGRQIAPADFAWLVHYVMLNSRLAPETDPDRDPRSVLIRKIQGEG